MLKSHRRFCRDSRIQLASNPLDLAVFDAEGVPSEHPKLFEIEKISNNLGLEKVSDLESFGSLNISQCLL